MSAPPRPLRAYAAVTAAYWAFMLTDGALRMLVLLHLSSLGFSALHLAWLFLLYELAGIVTNLYAGWLAARFGLAATLYAGLIVQIAALLALTALDPTWGIAASVGFVMAVQGLSGVAKDLAKMSSKSAVKPLAPDGAGLLSRVAWLTGSKNAVKGVGFFFGAAMLGLIGFDASLWTMAAVLSAIWIAVAALLPTGLPARNKGAKLSAIWSVSPQIKRLSLARMFLFGARDVWFVVGIPIYFQSVLSDGTVEGRREAFFLIGGFMAVWIILYGAVQALAPRLLRAGKRSQTDLTKAATTWATLLVPLPFVLAALAFFGVPNLTVILVVGLLAFGFLLAVNSALHSYLVLAFSGAGRMTMDVGSSYMANAAGRLLGTALSGLSVTFCGLPACLATAGLMAGLCAWAARRL